MILLLTGEPGVGKSTIIEKLIARNAELAQWVVTSSIPRPQGGRAGFVATSSDGVRRVISHKTDIASDIIVGENHVDLEAVDAMFAQALKEATRPSGTLTIVDEIGPIQLFSPAFTAALDRAFSSSVDLVATIHYRDERLEKYRNSPHALLLRVTSKNRDMLPDALLALLQSRALLKEFSSAQRAVFLDLARGYINDAKPVQIQKLTHNAIYYVQAGHVKQKDNTTWTVTGRHGSYQVTLNDGSYTCQCDLFNGRGEYAGQAGECSHVQAVKMSAAKGA